MEQYHQLVRDICTYLQIERPNAPPPPKKQTVRILETPEPTIIAAPAKPMTPMKRVEPVVQELRSVIQKSAPQLRLRTQPPDDRRAREVALAWATRVKREPVAIVCDREKLPIQEMLKRLTDAISKQLAPARLIEARFWGQNHLWPALLASPTLRLVVVPTDVLEAHPELHGTVSILKIAPWSMLAKTPEAKQQLWATLQVMLKTNG